jgi:hypothetical protein
MNLNEKGYTYPIVLMIMIISCLFFTFQLQLFLSEKQIHHESKKILQQEYYFHTALKKIEVSLLNNHLTIGTGVLVFHSGVVNYRIEAFTTSLLKITISIKLGTSGEVVGIAYYDKNQFKMVKWIEKN